MTVENMKELTHFFVDVDGTLTDSGIYYDSLGNELKKFSVRDYVGVVAAHYIGIKIIILTGRECKATEQRAHEMKVDLLVQNVKNKKDYIYSYICDNRLEWSQVGYIGDDLNDYSAMKYAGFKACPSDASQDIISIVDYVSPMCGGKGVLQDVFRYILSSLNRWNQFVEDVIKPGY